jgi:hypothetical protein
VFQPDCVESVPRFSKSSRMVELLHRQIGSLDRLGVVSGVQR